ncbi:hypothetical protein V5F34_22555 [Xanthobacter autotrophicus]
MSRAALRRTRIILTENGLHPAEVRILPLVAEPDFFAVGEKDKGHAEQIGITPPLRLTRRQADTRALRFQHGDRTAEAIKQHIVRPAAIIGGYSYLTLRPSVRHHAASFRSWSILIRANASLVNSVPPRAPVA